MHSVLSSSFRIVGGVILALAASVASPAHGLEFQVTTTADTDDGVCDADCSIREAAAAANASPGFDTVVIPGGVYTIALGQIEFTDDVEVGRGLGIRPTIDGDGQHQIFKVGSGSAVFDGLIVQNGFAEQSGAGFIANPDTFLQIRRSIVRDHQTDGSAGALLARRRARIEVYDSTFSGNRTVQRGGAIELTADAELEVHRSLFFDNDAVAFGDAINGQFAGEIKIHNSTFHLNGGGSDPEVIRFSNTVDVRSSLFTTGELNFSSNSVGTFANNIVMSMCGGGAVVSLGGNIEAGSDTCGFDQPSDRTGVKAAEVGLGELGNNGGPTRTILPSAGGIAVDAAVEALCSGFDQRGTMRPIDGDGDGTARCDVGPVEIDLFQEDVFADDFESGDVSAWE